MTSLASSITRFSVSRWLVALVAACAVGLLPSHVSARQLETGVPVVLGHKIAAAAARNTESSETSSKIPIGHVIFRTIAEVEHGSIIEEGVKVDVAHVTPGEEGPVAKIMLRGLTITSVEAVAGEVSDVLIESDLPPEDDAEPPGESILAAPDHGGFYKTLLIGIAIDASQLERLRMAEATGVLRVKRHADNSANSPLQSILNSFLSNLFQPLLLFFFMGFAIPLLKVPFEFPKALYQSLVIYLLIAIGWHGGSLMAHLTPNELAVAGGLAAVGFFANGIIGYTSTMVLSRLTPMRRIDAVTVGAYYGSDSAGTFVTCLGILATLGLLHDSYMPVMLAVMEIPGCLVGLFLVSNLRMRGMDPAGNMPGERGYTKPATNAVSHGPVLSLKLLHEVFLNPGLYMLFGGIIVGFISGVQALKDPAVVEGPNHLFLFIFKGALCLFLLEMGMTACQRLRDLKTAGWGFIAFGLFAPVVFATFGMGVLHAYSLALGHHFELGTYALFAVLCGAASYIAVPAVQRIAIPEASPTLPLAASLGLTFTWNVTIGIPLYIEIAKMITTAVPLGG
ncbi:MAG: sodium-dependent bicarbonate transport family permease [Pirellulales bacterium]